MVTARRKKAPAAKGNSKMPAALPGAGGPPLKTGAEYAAMTRALIVELSTMPVELLAAHVAVALVDKVIREDFEAHYGPELASKTLEAERAKAETNRWTQLALDTLDRSLTEARKALREAPAKAAKHAASPRSVRLNECGNFAFAEANKQTSKHRTTAVIDAIRVDVVEFAKKKGIHLVPSNDRRTIAGWLRKRDYKPFPKR